MRYREIGNSSILVPVIGQGTMGISANSAGVHNSDVEAVALLRKGIDLGMTLVDTAENYGGGHVEEIVGKAVKGIRDKVVIASKVAPEHLGYDNLIDACEGSLKRLRTDYIDIYQVHWPNQSIPIMETMGAMETLKKEGKIRAIGVCNFSIMQVQEATTAITKEDLVSSQVEYNLFDRSIENDMLPYCQATGMTVMAYSPFDQGVIDQHGHELLNEIAERYDVTPAQIVLNWLVSHPSVIVIPKASKIQHLHQNASAVDFQLSNEDFKGINDRYVTRPIEVFPEKIKVVQDGMGMRQAYQTVEQALKNDLNFTPSPNQLAQHMLGKDKTFKPVRVRRSKDPSGQYEYDLVEGRIRYWAWVIAHEGKKTIRCLVRE